MRLTIKEPEIEIGTGGFEGHCQLGRAETGKKLSELVEKVEDPIVIALDGSWGSGKSFFLKCWVGEHTKDDNNKAKVVYFDAFQHDFLDDPLIALTGVLADKFKPESKAGKALGLAKTAVSKMLRPAARISLAAATAGGSEVVAATAAELAKSSEVFWQKEDGRRAAIEEFREALKKLTEPAEGGDAQKIVIIIDELDRCRPDYALSMLEVIKHFFAVDNVVFILGANLEELKNSVRARYGEGINAGKYLQKFIHLTLNLTGPKTTRHGNTGAKYFSQLAKYPENSEAAFIPELEDYLRAMPHENQITLRDAQRLMTKAKVISHSNDITTAEKIAVAGMMILEVCKPEWVPLILDKKIPTQDALHFFGQDGAPYDDTTEYDYTAISWVWKLCLDPDYKAPQNLNRGEPVSGIGNNDSVTHRAGILARVYNTHLLSFQIPR